LFDTRFTVIYSNVTPHHNLIEVFTVSMWSREEKKEKRSLGKYVCASGSFVVMNKHMPASLSIDTVLLLWMQVAQAQDRFMPGQPVMITGVGAVETFGEG
jgi:hypothetical protein